MLKKIIHSLSAFLCIATLIVCGCTADMNEFGESDYRTLNGLSFKDQTGSTSFRTVTRTIGVSFDFTEKPDSITVESMDISSLAELHRVDSKIDSIPSDSTARDSLGNVVSVAKNALAEGSKIALPKSLKIYLAVVSESGLRDVWCLQVTLSGVPVESSSSTINSSGSSSSSTTSSSSVNSSSSSSFSSSSSEPVLNSNTDLTLKLNTQLAQSVKASTNHVADTIYTLVAFGTDFATLSLASVGIASTSSVSPDPTKVTDFTTAHTFTVTAEDKTTQAWVFVVAEAAEDYKASSEKELVSITATGELKAATVDASKKTVLLHLASQSALSNVAVTLVVSNKATATPSSPWNLSTDPLDLTITAEDGSTVVWKVTADYAADPEIVSLSATNAASVTIDQNLKKIYIEMAYLANLTQVTISALGLSEGASTAGITKGSAYDLSAGLSVLVSVGENSVTYTVKAGYQIPYSNFDSWDNDDYVLEDPTYGAIWGNANSASKNTTQVTVGSGSGAQMKTSSILGKIASGSIYTAEFNPNGVGLFSMASSSTWPDGNELIDFGKPFKGHPEYADVKFSYSNNDGDSCDIYIMLENRTGDKNVDRTSTDVNTLVASAWFRSTSESDYTTRPNPDVVSISEPDVNGMRTLRLKLQYGTPLTNSPIWNSSAFATGVSSSNNNAIDNSVVEGSGKENVTHIRVVFASSAAGNFYTGTSGATLVVDDFKFIY